MSKLRRMILHPTGRWAALLVLAAVALSGAFARAQPPSFQPLLLAFDPAQDRLFAAAAAEGRRGVQLFVFPQPGKQGARPGASLDLTGMISGLSYDSDSKTLFVADAAEHALLIFDRFDPRSTTRANRVLKRFNFPTGVYADRSRLFVADAHPGALLVFEKGAEVDGERRPDRTIGPEKSGLNGPFAIAADPDRGRLYVSNFDGVLAFHLADLAAPPDRLPLPKGTLARGLAFDSRSKRLYIAAPMIQSYFVYEGERMEQVRIQGASGSFPFSITIDSKENRLYLAGIAPEIGVIEQASGGTGEKERAIDRWIRWEGEPREERPPPAEERGPAPEGPSMIRWDPS
jgi:DNA-binding beta-propeller fold protein YncE